MEFPAVSINGGIVMKVVLVKSPKILSGFLRMIFGIKKQNV
ncbi:MAG: stage V sporulation protein SpoVM [Clostridia bacterium]|nr:stage V sporulation protein SpoVM [Clostridia bacterium]